MRYVIIALTLWASFQMDGKAQQRFTLDAAISKALEDNFNVRIARNAVEIAENADNIGNAGFLPSVNANAGYQYSNNNTTLEILSTQPGQPNQTIQIDGAVSTVRNAGLNLSYTLFDGLANVYTKNQLEVASEQAALQLRQQMEQTISEVSNAYINAFLASKNAEVAEEAVRRSRIRYDRALENFERGLVNRVEVLAAEVDLNADSLSLETARLGYRNTLRNLFVLLGEEQPLNLELNQPALLQAVDRSILEEDTQTYNALLRSNELQLDVAELNYKLTLSAFAPQLEANGSYNWSRTENEAGLLAFQENSGFSGGVSLNVGIFNGFQRSIRKQNAALSVKNARLQQEQTELQVNTAFQNAWDTYENARFQAEILKRNLKTAELNFERSKELFESGQLTAVQIRDAQLAYQQAEIGLLSQQLQAFLAQVELQRLSGRLVGR